MAMRPSGFLAQKITERFCKPEKNRTIVKAKGNSKSLLGQPLPLHKYFCKRFKY